jgi:hypothetical protein
MSRSAVRVRWSALLQSDFNPDQSRCVAGEADNSNNLAARPESSGMSHLIPELEVGAPQHDGRRSHLWDFSLTVAYFLHDRKQFRQRDGHVGKGLELARGLGPAR